MLGKGDERVLPLNIRSCSADQRLGSTHVASCCPLVGKRMKGPLIAFLVGPALLSEQSYPLKRNKAKERKIFSSQRPCFLHYGMLWVTGVVGYIRNGDLQIPWMNLVLGRLLTACVFVCEVDITTPASWLCRNK